VPSANPHFRETKPAALEYLRCYVLDSADVPWQGDMETPKAYKKRIYMTLKTIFSAPSTLPDMRITRLWSHSDWPTIRKNITSAPITDTDRTVWDRAIHDILPTNERLHKIRMSPTDCCKECDEKNIVIHCLTECAEGQLMWDWTRHVIASMLSTIPERIPMNGCYVHNFPYGLRHATTRYYG